MSMSVSYTNFCGEIVHEDRANAERFYVLDTLGNTVELLDASSTVSDIWNYWPFGEIRARSGITTTPFSFVGTLGYYLDTFTNRLYVRARYLRQSISRWQSVDPLWPEQPPYLYASNRPTFRADPSGMDDCDTMMSHCDAKVSSALQICAAILALAGAVCVTLCVLACGASVNPLLCRFCVFECILTVLLALLICYAIFKCHDQCFYQWCKCRGYSGQSYCPIVYARPPSKGGHGCDADCQFCSPIIGYPSSSCCS